MSLYKNERQYAQLLVTPHRRSVTVKPGELIEGSFFARYSTLTEVPEGTAGKVVWSQSEWAASKMPPYVKDELGKRGLLPATEVELVKAAPEPDPEPEPVAPVEPPPVEEPVAPPVEEEAPTEEEAPKAKKTRKKKADAEVE